MSPEALTNSKAGDLFKQMTGLTASSIQSIFSEVIGHNKSGKITALLIQ